MLSKNLPLRFYYLALLTVIAALMGITDPPYCNPDTSFYFGVALRVSRGQFASSVDGLYSPLLSWLMAIPVALGVELIDAYRIVNYLALVSILASLKLLAARFEISGLPRVYLHTLTLVQFAHFAFILVTSDVVAAAINSWIAVLLLAQLNRPNLNRALLIGTLGGLGYFAKAIQLPIFLLAASSFTAYKAYLKPSSVTREALLLAVTLAACLSICSPWIYLLSKKYGTFAISGQQLVFSYQLALTDYHPDLFDGVSPATQLQRSPQPRVDQAEQRAAEQGATISRWKELLILSLSTILSDSRLPFGLSSIFLLYITLSIAGGSRLIQRGQLSGPAIVLTMLMLCQTLVYMNIWGGRFRYYLPIVPVMNVFFSASIAWMAEFKHRYLGCGRAVGLMLRHLPLLAGGIVIGAVAGTTYSAARLYDSFVDKEALAAVARHPLIVSSNAPLAGRTFGVYSSLVAARLKREHWYSIDPTDFDNPMALRAKLKSRKVGQIIWEGTPDLGLLEATGDKAELIYMSDQLRIYLLEPRQFGAAPAPGHGT